MPMNETGNEVLVQHKHCAWTLKKGSFGDAVVGLGFMLSLRWCASFVAATFYNSGICRVFSVNHKLISIASFVAFPVCSTLKVDTVSLCTDGMIVFQ